MKNFSRFRVASIIGLLFCLAIAAGCTLDMRDQPRYEPFEESAIFADGASVRPPVADTVARGQLRLDAHLYTGRVNNLSVDTFPFTVTVAILERGRERYDIFCTPCHGMVGDGSGIVTEYGMEAPPSFHNPDLRDASAGHYFRIISNGTRVMPSYAARIPVEDRWAIVAYIRALQLSQNADASQLPADELPELDATDTITN
jgi:hypothetical protein